MEVYIGSDSGSVSDTVKLAMDANLQWCQKNEIWLVQVHQKVTLAKVGYVLENLLQWIETFRGFTLEYFYKNVLLKQEKWL